MSIPSLKMKIKEAADAGRALRARIHGAAGPSRDALWNEKRSVGRRARGLLLAYGYLRSRPYR